MFCQILGIIIRSQTNFLFATFGPIFDGNDIFFIVQISATSVFFLKFYRFFWELNLQENILRIKEKVTFSRSFSASLSLSASNCSFSFCLVLSLSCAEVSFESFLKKYIFSYIQQKIGIKLLLKLLDVCLLLPQALIFSL